MAARDLPADAPTQAAVAEFTRLAREVGGTRVLEIRVFGSVARGQARPGSDIDLLVRWDGPEKEGRDLLDPLAFGIFLRDGILVSPYIVSVAHWQALQDLQSPFLRDVQREGIIVEG